MMLTLSQDAAVLVRTLTRSAALSDTGGGIRIAVDPAHHSLSMSVATTPEPTDMIVDAYGAHVFLSPSAATKVAYATLNAEVGAARSVFYLDR